MVDYLSREEILAAPERKLFTARLTTEGWELVSPYGGVTWTIERKPKLKGDKWLRKAKYESVG